MTVKMDVAKAVRQIKADPAVARELLQDGWKVAERAAQLAPKSVGPGGGAGAKSIRAELATKPGDPNPEVRVSWDRDHFYMGFAETGTAHQAPSPFLRPAAREFR